MKFSHSIFALIIGISAFSIADAHDCPKNERLFEHELLATAPVCVPNQPQRIVALDMGAAELTLLSGKQLSGAANWLLAEMSVLSPEFSGILPQVINVGYPASLEKLAEIQPDIILAVGTGKGVHKGIDVSGAQKIAPVIVAKPVIYDDWKISAEFWAQALNEQVLYQRLFANYQTRVDEIKSSLGESAGQTVSIVGKSAYGTSLWLKDTPPAAIIADLGLTRPDSQNYDKQTAKSVYQDVRYPMISEEKLDLADADNVFVFSYPSHDERGQKKQQRLMKQLQGNPLWKILSATKNHRVFYVGGHWWRCNSYLLANKVLDDVAKYIAKKQPETPALTYPIFH